LYAFLIFLSFYSYSFNLFLLTCQWHIWSFVELLLNVHNLCHYVHNIAVQSYAYGYGCFWCAIIVTQLFRPILCLLQFDLFSSPSIFLIPFKHFEIEFELNAFRFVFFSQSRIIHHRSNHKFYSQITTILTVIITDREMRS
jgi:hypothetical protein